GTASVTVVNPPPGGGTSNTVTFTVGLLPAIQPPFTATGIVGVPFSYKITASNNPISFSATGLPNGLNPPDNSGVISGTPTAAGIYQATISATNAGGTGNATLIITINPFFAVGTQS